MECYIFKFSENGTPQEHVSGHCSNEYFTNGSHQSYSLHLSFGGNGTMYLLEDFIIIHLKEGEETIWTVDIFLGIGPWWYDDDLFSWKKTEPRNRRDSRRWRAAFWVSVAPAPDEYK
jgi:hypothetical protein